MIVHKDSGSLLLRVQPHSYETLCSILPQNMRRDINYAGHNLAVPHNLKMTKILRNMGISAPSPIRYFYNWPRPARFASVYEHQYATAEFLTLNAKCFVLNEMGTMKTSSTCWAADYLMTLGEIRRVLIVAPLSVLEEVWIKELFDVCMHRTATVLYGDAEKRRMLFDRPSDFYIINPDGLKIISKQLQSRSDIDLVIVDEAADYRNAGTAKYAMLEKVTRQRRLWLLTGAPCPQAPTDAWALARLVDKRRVPEHFTTFKRQVMQQISTYVWRPKPGSHEEAYRALQPAIRFRKRDCVNLPPVSEQTRVCELTPEQVRVYDAMKTHLVAEAQAGHTVTAANAADKIAKLRQILLGAIKDGDEYVTIDHSKRFNVLTDCIDQAAAKVLVIVPYKGIARALTDEVNAWHDGRKDGRKCALVNGDISIHNRNKIFQEFRENPDLTELICHPKVMSHGLTLTEADMLVMYGPINSNDQDAQVKNRFDRPGQTRSMTIVKIAANALEKNLYAVVEGRADHQNSMLALYNNELGIV